jgi:hypothetical protein
MTETETKTPESGTGSQGVQLGIGTLAIIAIIVTMCSGRGEMDEIKRDTAQLKQQLGAIDKKLDTLVEKERAAASTDVEAPSQNP